MTEDRRDPGGEMDALIRDLYPICRSITGDGLRQTLRRIQREIPIEIHEVPTGTEVFDWTVPREWNIRDAYVKNSRGERVIDFQRSNLHVVNYSVPVRRTMTIEELRPHLFSLPEKPDWVPYRTSYYRDFWGFCLKHTLLEQLSEDDYEVCIDSTLDAGSLSYGEFLIPGESPDEVLISCHSCHPSLANDNLSGVAVAVALARTLASERHNLSYRFLFIPGTIGSITWLSRNQEAVSRIRHGLVLSCVGDAGPFTYKRSRQGDALIDRAVEHVLSHESVPSSQRDFVPYGYDERQYCSPGFNLPVGCFMRTPNGEYPQYHTSADDVEFISHEALLGSYEACRKIFAVLEHDGRYLNQNPLCEPQLGRRGLYGSLGGQSGLPGYEMAMLWVLNLSDGEHSLLDVSERAGTPFEIVHRAAMDLVTHGLLEPVLEPITLELV